MSEWKKVKLGDLTSKITKGTTPSNIGESFCNRGVPFIRSELITQNKYISDEGILYISNQTHEKLKRSQLEVNDILFSMAGVYLGKTAILRECDVPANTNQAVAIIRLDSALCSVDFVYYYLNKESVIRYVNQISGQAAQPNINLQQIGEIPIVLPSRKEQQSIATILSRYDSLIENYQEQIKLLEEAAQRLYKEWFVDLHFPGHETTKIVDGVPEGWEKKPISQLGEYLNGFAFKPSDWQDSGKPIIKIKEMGNGVSNDTPRNNGERVPVKYLVKAGDLLFSWSATLMVIVWSGEEGWLNQHLFKVTPAKGIGREFLLQSISNTIEEFQNLTTGSTMKHIQRNKLDQVFTNVPNDEIMALYSNFAESMRNQILHLSSQISFLTEARDRLLPKLMNGEIKV